MKFLIPIISALMFLSCGTDEKTILSADYSVPERGELSQDSKIFLGNRLFSEKTCIKCHDINDVKTAPSVVEIMTVYKANRGDIVSFLKGDSKPIVDTSTRQVAIMQDNIDGFLKKISDEELDALATYMMHVDELSRR